MLMMILQLYVEDNDVVQNFRWSINVPDNGPKDYVDDASSLLLMILCRATQVIVVVNKIYFHVKGDCWNNVTLKTILLVLSIIIIPPLGDVTDVKGHVKFMR